MKTSDLSPIGTELLGSLFALFEKEESKDNEYVMKGLFHSDNYENSFFTSTCGILQPLCDHFLACKKR